MVKKIFRRFCAQFRSTPVQNLEKMRGNKRRRIRRDEKKERKSKKRRYIQNLYFYLF